MVRRGFALLGPDGCFADSLCIQLSKRQHAFLLLLLCTRHVDFQVLPESSSLPMPARDLHWMCHCAQILQLDSAGTLLCSAILAHVVEAHQERFRRQAASVSRLLWCWTFRLNACRTPRLVHHAWKSSLLSTGRPATSLWPHLQRQR